MDCTDQQFFSFMLFWRLSSHDVSVLRVQLQQDEILMQSFLLRAFPTLVEAVVVHLLRSHLGSLP